MVRLRLRLCCLLLAHTHTSTRALAAPPLVRVPHPSHSLTLTHSPEMAQLTKSTSPLAVDISVFTQPNNPVSLKPVPLPSPSHDKTPSSGGTAHLLPAERARATFDVEKMTNALDGGPKRTARRRFIISPTEDTDMFDKYFWSRGEHIAEHVRFFLQVGTR